MKKKIVSSLLIATLTFAALTGCDSSTAEKAADTIADYKGDEDSASSTAELSDEEKALAQELVTRHVTAEDNVTKNVVEETLRLVKETYEFEQGVDEIKFAADETGYVAQGYGWFDLLFADAGIKVTEVQGAEDSEEELMERGDLTFANRMLYPYLLNKERGAELIAVWATQNPRPDIVSVIVRADSDYETFADLKGKKIASSTSSCPYCVTEELVLNEGWEEGVDFEFVNTKEYVNALIAGEVDAIIYHPGPAVNPILLSGEARVLTTALADGAYVNGGGSRVIFTTKEFAEKNPNITKAYLKLQELTKAYIILHKEEAGAVNESVSRVPAENAIYWWEASAETMLPTQSSIEEIYANTENFYNWLLEYDGAFTGGADLTDLYAEEYFE